MLFTHCFGLMRPRLKVARAIVSSYDFFVSCLFLFLGGFLNICTCSTAKSTTPLQETLFYPLNGTEHGSQPSLTTRDRELVSVLEGRIEPGDLNPRPLTPQSVTLPTLPRAQSRIIISCSLFSACVLFLVLCLSLLLFLCSSVGGNTRI